MQRNVEFNKWIPRTETKNGGYTTDYPYAGIFLDWGLDSDEGASYTVALVEMADGSVELVVPTRMRFCVPTPLINHNDIPTSVGGAYNHAEEEKFD